MFEFKSRPSGRAVARALLLPSTAVAALSGGALAQEAGNSAQLPEITIEAALPAAKKAEKKAAKKAATATTSAAAAESSEAGPPEGPSNPSGESEGSGTQTIIGEAPSEPEQDDRQSTAKGLCAFAAAMAAAALPEPLSLSASISHVITAFASRNEQPAIERYEQPRPARGPPLLG